MRYALTLLPGIASLAGVNPQRAKEFLRRRATGFCRTALRWLSEPYGLPSNKAVVFAPHQDDETLGCGGLIARKRNEGLPVDVVFITDGCASHPGHPRLSPRAIAAIRRKEAREALAILGVESVAIHFLNEPDGTLNQLDLARRATLVARITELLCELQPDEIFLPCNPDGSSEHDAAFAFIIEAARRANLKPAIWQYPVWSWWNPLLMLERILFTKGWCQVPTEDYALIKSRALACYRSQTEPLPPQREAALPPELVRIFSSDVEYFFRYQPAVAPRGREAPTSVI